MKRRSFIATLGAGVAGAWLPPLPSLPKLKLERFVERWSWAMGQPVHIMVYTDSEDQGLEGCANVLAELRRLEGLFSLFDDASELCELNRRAGKRPLTVSKEMMELVRLADHVRRFTNGAFNPAVEPLMRVWGFHRTRQTMPSPNELAAARTAVATATVRTAGYGSLILPNSHTKLDFGGIAVGYAIDEATKMFFRSGVQRAFIDVSGDCYGMGTPPGETGWPVQIAGSSRELRLHDTALATSSNRESLIELERHLLGHVMDPARGCPVDTRRQVTQHGSCAVLADALSTAALVTGRAHDPVWPTYFTE